MRKSQTPWRCFTEATLKSMSVKDPEITRVHFFTPPPIQLQPDFKYHQHSIYRTGVQIDQIDVFRCVDQKFIL